MIFVIFGSLATYIYHSCSPSCPSRLFSPPPDNAYIYLYIYILQSREFVVRYISNKIKETILSIYMNGYKCGISGKYPYKLFRWSKLQFYFMSLGRTGGYDMYCTYYYDKIIHRGGYYIQYPFYCIQLLYPSSHD